MVKLTVFQQRYINDYNCASDDNHDSINAFDNQLDAILHCVGSEYMEFSK